MNNIQTNKLNMYHVVSDYLNVNKNVLIANSPILADIINDFNQLFVAIKNESQKQGISTLGTTEEKADTKNQMAILAVAISGAIYTYAHRNKKTDIAKKVDYSKSEINKSKDTDAVNMARIIYDEASALLPHLAAYGVNSELLASLLETINKFEMLIGKRGSVSADHTTTTEVLQNLFKSIDSNLKNEMDPQMLMFKIANPALYANYINARQIIDLGSRPKSKTKHTPVD